MKYDKSLKTKEDKKLWDYLLSGIFADIKAKCIILKRKFGWTKKEIVDKFRPIYGACDGSINTSGMGIFDCIRARGRLEKAIITILRR